MSTVCEWFDLKTTHTVFSGFASKLVATVFFGLTLKLVARLPSLGLKTGSSSLVIWASKTPRRFLGLSLKIK
jgi:hypothetical protein